MLCEDWNQAAVSQEGTSRSRGEAWNRLCPPPLRGNQPCQHLIMDFQSPEQQDDNLLQLKPPSLWYVVRQPQGTNTGQQASSPPQRASATWLTVWVYGEVTHGMQLLAACTKDDRFPVVWLVHGGPRVKVGLDLG